jgi:hypothetical protein
MGIPKKLSLAASRVAEHYFALPVAGRDKPLLRERVYCYELYHQLRCILPHDTRLVLTAEPDKRSNPSFTQGHPIPDFIFHEPGSHVQNRAVIEAECRVDRRHLQKDVHTFWCLQEKGYQQFILLLFGVKTVPWDILAQVVHEVGMQLDQILVLLHAEAGSKAYLQERSAGTVPRKPETE